MKKYINICLLTVLLFGFTNCENYLDINTDPNNLTEIPNGLGLPSTQVGIGFFIGSDVFLYTSLWVQHIAGMANEMSGRDVYSTSSVSGLMWNQFYGIVANLNRIEEDALAKEDFIHAGMAQSLKAYLFAVGTDIWGDIPFEESSQGTANLNPNFTAQETIYRELLLLLDQAIGNLNNSNAVENASAGDLVYNGDSDKWIQFANAVKLKLYLNMKFVATTEATNGINALIASGQLLTNYEDDFTVPYGSAITAQNPIYQFQYVTRQPDSGITNRLYNYYQSNNDPRTEFMFRPGGSNPSDRTFDNGDGFLAIDNDPNRLRWGQYIVGGVSEGDAPMRLVTASMVHFMLAEAYLTMPGINGDAVTLAKQSLEAALDQHFGDIASYVGAGQSFTDESNTYINGVLDDFDNANADEKLRIVMTEKWASLLGNSYESFNDFRRTRLPEMLSIPNQEIAYPERMPYPISEANLNPNFPSDYNFQPADLVKKPWWVQ